MNFHFVTWAVDCYGTHFWNYYHVWIAERLILSILYLHAYDTRHIEINNFGWKIICSENQIVSCFFHSSVSFCAVYRRNLIYYYIFKRFFLLIHNPLLIFILNEIFFWNFRSVHRFLNFNFFFLVPSILSYSNKWWMVFTFGSEFV